MKPIPSPITVNTGKQEEVSKTIDDFFIETKNSIQSNCETKETDFETKSGELAYSFSQITDDRITYLSYKDNIIASVFEIRTEFNHVRYTFFRNMDGF